MRTTTNDGENPTSRLQNPIRRRWVERSLVFLLVAFVAVSYASAQEENWFVGKPIEDIRFEGLNNVSEADLEAIIRPFIGENFQNNLYYDLQSKIYALDYFEYFEVSAEPANDQRTGVILEFDVVERPLVGSVEIEGNRFIRQQDILDEILLKEGDIVTTASVRADVETIRSLYLERGFPDVAVTGDFERVSDAEARVVFEIEEGTQRKVSEIRFSGNTFASPSTLKRVISTKEQSLFNTGVFQEAKLAEDIQAIQQYYWDRGYIDAEVVDVVRELDEENSNLILTYYVEEGVQYTFGGISFEGNTLYSDERLAQTVRQQEGEVLSRTQLQADLFRARDLYFTDGYLFNGFDTREIRDEQNRTISYVVEIVERGRAHIANVIISGNEKTADEVIRRELPFEAGDIFSTRTYAQGEQNLRNLQYFSTVLFDVVTGNADGLVDVTIDLEEGRTTDINFGVTFSGVEEGFPVIGFLKWTDSNFRGRGQELSVGTEISASSQSLNFGFKENWLFGQRWSGGIDVSAEHSLTQGIQQDILAPVFSPDDTNAVPDPFTGQYVWAEDNSQSETAGAPFSGNATELIAAIAAGEVLTDYAYAVTQGDDIDPGYLMDYDSYDFSVGLSTGYTFVLPLGRLGFGTRLTTTLSYIDYDQTINRPFDSTIRNNWHVLLPITTWLFNTTWDTRDLVYSPSKGVYLRQSVTFAGGFLPSTRDYVKTASKAQAFLTLFDVPVFDNWNFKGVLAANTALSFVLNPFVGDYAATTQDLLYIDGMTIARGWPRLYDGRALWNNWVELRMPIAEQYIWFDTFIDGTALWTSLDDFSSMSIGDFRFGFGGGIRLTIPGLPIGLYLTKRFRITNDNAFEWQGGNIFSNADNPASGIDLVISFTAEVF